jgi:hypothetical protein
MQRTSRDIGIHATRKPNVSALVATLVALGLP